VGTLPGPQGEPLEAHASANPVNAFTMGGIVRDAGLTVEQFKKLL
jgi:hypothetical protein